MSGIKEKISDIFSLWQRGLCPGGQVLVRKDGEIIYDQCFGYADIERGVKVTPDTIFHVASVSKQITTMSVFLLRERGLVDIDKDIRTYIPDLIAFSEPVTVRNMMNNVSGIRDQWVLQMYSGVRMNDVITQNDLLYLNKRQKSLNFPPLSKYLYSNTNFVFLSEIVKRISGMTLNEFAMENIFKPLNMEKTFIRNDYDDLVENRALSYIDTGNDTYKWRPLNFTNNGATSLHTTANDFMKWLNNFENPTICTPETIEEMQKVPSLTTSETTTYASGLMIEEKCGHRSIGHGGADAGYRAHVLHYPADKLDIVVLSNTENILMSPAAFKIADIVLSTNSFEAKSPHYSPEPKTPVYGDFCITEMPLGVSITEESGKPFIKIGQKKVPLIHKEGNRYSASYLPEEVYCKDDGMYFGTSAAHYKMKPLSEALFTPGELAQMEGVYYTDEIEGLYRITVNGKKASLEQKRFGTAEILEVSDGVYYCPLEKEILFKFIKNENGIIKGMTFMDARVLSIDLHKVNIVF